MLAAPRARIRRRELPVGAALDWLCGMVEDLTPPSPKLHGGGRSSDSARYERMGGGQGGAGAWLATVTRRRLYDEVGRLVEVGGAGRINTRKCACA